MPQSRSANRWSRLCCGCAAIVLLSGMTACVSAAERPNILWITVEDMSATLGCWGDSYANTPHIDQLARESVKYTQAFATAPVCSPARSCLITGCYATSLGTQRLRSEFPIPAYMTGFPSLLRQAGYYCTNNVKTDYNTSNAPEIIAASWDESSNRAHWRKRGAGQPFFAVFNHMTSHQSRTMVIPEREFRETVQSRLSAEQIHDPALAPIPPYYPDTPQMRRSVARYYDCITAMDMEVGALLDQLRADGLAEDTIVFFFSDHGSGMPRHKRALLDTGLHVPLLIRFPAKYQHLAPHLPGAQEERLVSFVDFPPSLLNLCGLEIPSYMQGLPFLGPDSAQHRQYVYGARDRVDEAFDLARCVRNERYLYIRNFMPHLSYHQPSSYPDRGVIRAEITRYAREHADSLTPAQAHYVAAQRPIEELYDVQQDPWNERNLADLPDYQAIKQRMRRALLAWILDVRDVGFLPEEEMWARLDKSTPYELRMSEPQYPLQNLLRIALRVGAPGVGDLRPALTDREPGVRYWAAITAGAQQNVNDDTRALLQQLLHDPRQAVRIEAAYAVAKLGDPDQSVPVLVDCLQQDDVNVVLHAARAVELLGLSQEAVVAAMRAAGERARATGRLRCL